jgi:hypothetical protein
MRFDLGAARVLDFDCESRPTGWIGRDRVSAEVTAIAWAWPRGPRPGRVRCRLLGEYTADEMLADFVEEYAAADVVTGHNVRAFDLPLLNAELLRAGLPPLPDVMVQDTWADLVKRRDMSASQKNLAEALGVRAKKLTMSQAGWAEANALTDAGLLRVRRRVVGDVRQHVELRARMLDVGLLGPPRRWSSFGRRVP